jgi:sugar phosphate isomerase/epimerase
MSFYGDFEQNIAGVKAIGYEALELFVRNPKEMDIDAVRRLIEKSGLNVAAVGTNPAMIQDGLTLLDQNKEIRRKAVERALDIIDFAAFYGAPVCIGKFRGNLWKGEEQAADEELRRAFSAICEHAVKRNMTIMLEPQNRGNINNLNTVAETLAWIDAQNFTNLGILYDIFHGDLSEVSVASGILNGKGKIGFIHCADSKRLPPGAGNIHLADAFAVLKNAGYTGYVSMELNQTPDSFTVAELAYKNVRYILDYIV